MNQTQSCECEHIAHFEQDYLTPNGNPGHEYGSKFHKLALKHVGTHYGTFTVCLDCARDCHQDSYEVQPAYEGGGS